MSGDEAGSAAVDRFLEGCAEPQQPVLRALRRLLREIGPDLEESIKWGKPVFGRGRTNMYSIIPHSRYVNLQIFNGAALADPDGLLEGTGKNIRHVKCRTPEDCARPELRRLLEASLTRSGLGPAA